jgi:hypothetical protein
MRLAFLELYVSATAGSGAKRTFGEAVRSEKHQ